MTRIKLPAWEVKNQQMKRALTMSIAELGISVRTVNCLEEHAAIATVEDLLNHTPEELLALPNFGPRTLEEVYSSLDRLGFRRPCLVA